eukprot:scaffold15987_cov42-Prasinocladus_malaysianus.AAC.1
MSVPKPRPHKAQSTCVAISLQIMCSSKTKMIQGRVRRNSIQKMSVFSRQVSMLVMAAWLWSPACCKSTYGATTVASNECQWLPFNLPENLPVLIIKTAPGEKIQDEPKISASLTVCLPNGETDYVGDIGIEVRRFQLKAHGVPRC